MNKHGQRKLAELLKDYEEAINKGKL